VTTSPDGARWTRLRAAVEGALALPAAERDAFLDALCAGDVPLRADAGRLLDACVSAGESSTFFSEAAAEYAAPILAGVEVSKHDPDDTLARLREGLASTYDVEREIGAGGMATVYLARDRKHDRRVAIKVLRPELAASLGAERFLTEIRVTANLQHPNLLSLFDSGDVNGLLYYVMPFVEGESLRARLERERQLPVHDAVRLAVAIAGALDYAHRRGVVHRDLKPENILLHEGEPLVADFGIALALSTAGASRVTQTGMSLGTPSYMSPEQATADRVIDARSDIYALGCVLFEMLSGEPPHTGASVQAIIARIMTEQPRLLRAERPSVPEHVDAAVQRALAKVPADRFATAREFASALDGSVTTAVASTSPRAVGSVRRWFRDPVRAMLALLCVVTIGALTLLFTRDNRSGSGRTARFVISALTDAPREGAPTITPDGQKMVYVGSASTHHAILVRRIDELGAVPLPGTEGAVSAFVSPDGKRIGFLTTDDKLKIVPMDGGLPTTVASLFRFTNARWAADGDIIADGSETGLERVEESGGRTVGITRVNEAQGESRHASPLVDGDGHVLFTIVRRRSGPATVIGDIGVAALDPKASLPQPHHLVGVSGRQSVAVVDGWLLYVSTEAKSILAVPYDRAAGRATGKPIVVLQDTAGVIEGVSLANNGTLLYTRRKANNAPVVVDGEGNVRRLLGGVTGAFMNPRLSPDGKRLAIQDASPQGNDIWVYDIASRTPTRLTTSGDALLPTWTPDGQYIVVSIQAQDGSYVRVRADGSAPAERIVGAGGLASTVAPDGRSLVFERRLEGAWSIWKAALNGDRHPVAVVKDKSDSYMPSLSPDGHWLAYLSDISGRHEVYVRPFPGGGAADQVSTTGGTEPLWSSDGKHLYYRAEGQFMDATLTLGARAAVVARRALFPDSFDGDMPHANYDVLRDGKGFVAIAAGAAAAPETVVILNWLTELRTRLAQR
jgi:serine/threonine protein kinase/Tol biopolymer transport system component